MYNINTFVFFFMEVLKLRKSKKRTFFIVSILILAFSYFVAFGYSYQNGDIPVKYIKGISDIRWGIDIKGGIEATFKPSSEEEVSAEQLDSAKSTIETRLVSRNITDYELYVDHKNQKIIVRFPWKSDESKFNPEKAIEEISSTALLTFRKGNSFETTDTNDDGETVSKTPKDETAENVLVEGKDIESASVVTQPKQDQNKNGLYNESSKLEYVVKLKFTEEGKEKFAQATKDNLNGYISIWMDDVMLSAPKVNSEITDGTAVISGDFTADAAKSLADKINSGSLPFKLETTNFSTISPTLGTSSLNAMMIAGIIAFVIICLMMIFFFRLPGVVACIALVGHLAISFAAISGFFSFVNSFTLTLPGIAGIILSIGMGVDANIIIASRIKEELNKGRNLSNSVKFGSKSSFWALFDGNVTVLIVALILMGIFGPANILSAIFGASTTGSIYSFGYTLFIGVISNFIMGITATRLMTRSISEFKFARNKWLYGGVSK